MDLGFKGKRGNLALGIILVIIVLVIFGIVSFIGKVVTSEMNDAIQLDDDLPQNSKDVMAQQNTQWGGLFDGIFLGVFVLFWLGLVLSSFLIDTHPVFFVLTLVMMIFIFMVAAFAGNVYEELTTDGDFEQYRPSFPATNWIFSHMLELIIGVFFTSAVALYAKSRN